MEKNNLTSDPQETRGWEIVKQLNANVPQCGNIEARKLLAEYFKLSTRRPSRLHSAILSCAVKMAMAFPEFHFVPFLDIWGIENLRPEDSEDRVEEGKRYPSLVEKMTKAYAYSLLFHPDEHMVSGMEDMLKPLLMKKGFLVKDVDGKMEMTCHAIATRVFASDVRNRKMYFVQFLLPNGDEHVAEIHTVTAYSKMRYEDIENRLFDVLLRGTQDPTPFDETRQQNPPMKMRVEAAVLSNCNIKDCFPTVVGYVEHIDEKNRHIHVFDNLSRHLVAKYITTNIKEGQYAEFVPVIPKVSNFKSAIICNVIENGAEAFGYRDATVTFTNEEQGYCAWELLPGKDGIVVPIMETGAKIDVEPANKGYISKQLVDKKGIPMPKKGSKLRIIAFLKRGKDGKKKAFVADFELD